jgi:hypothetical protein
MQMKYMLLMQGSQAAWKNFGSWPAKDIEAHIGFMQRLNADLRTSGEFVDAQGLTGPEQAKIVHARSDGSPAITDGPFPEAKEFLAGYWIVDCSPERVQALAAYISAAPGRDGVPLNMAIEIRPIGVAPKACV